MLVKTTAPRAQRRRAGSLAVPKISGPARRLAGGHGEPSPEDLAAAGVSVAGAGAGRCRTSSPAAGTAVPCGLPLAGCRPPPGPYERPARRASGAYDSLATICVTHGLLAWDECISSALTALIDVLPTVLAERACQPFIDRSS